MKKRIVFTFVVFFLGILGGTSYGQTVGKWTFSSMHTETPNDSVYQTSGQVISGNSDAPKVLHGYYPFQYSFVSLEEQELDFQIYPNPVQEEVFIEIDPAFGSFSFEIIDLQGKIVYSSLKNTGVISVNLDFLAPGVYSVILKSKEQLMTKKIIKS